MVSLQPIDENMCFREAEREFDRQLDDLMEKYQGIIPIDDMASIMNHITATPFTQAYLSELRKRFARYSTHSNWDKRREGRRWKHQM